MKEQPSFADLSYGAKKRVTRREKFLEQMEQMVPWARLVVLISPSYPRGDRGRPPKGIELMLRMLFLSQWYGLSDEATEDGCYDSAAFREFLGLGHGCDGVPDATTLLKFRHLLEEQGLCESIFAEINADLAERGLTVGEGTLVDATIIEAPSSTKNRDKARDPEMHQTKKGNQWYFGMKAHIGVDEKTKLVHTVHGTPANHSDVVEVAEVLHGGETRVRGDAGYTGAVKRPEMEEKFGDRLEEVDVQIAAKRSSIESMEDEKEKDLVRAAEKEKASVRAFVEHPFLIVKVLFGYRKVRYRGLAKNLAQQHLLFGLANLVIAARTLRKGVPA